MIRLRSHLVVCPKLQTKAQLVTDLDQDFQAELSPARASGASEAPTHD